MLYLVYEREKDKRRRKIKIWCDAVCVDATL